MSDERLRSDGTSPVVLPRGRTAAPRRQGGADRLERSRGLRASEADGPPRRGEPFGESSRPTRRPNDGRGRSLSLPRSRWAIVSLVGTLAGMAFLGLALMNREDGAGVSVRAGSRGALLAAGAATGESPLQGTDPVSSIDELHRLYGEPPDATLGRMRIPSLKINAPLSVRAVGPGGQMANPSGPDDIAYYDFSAWEGYGGYPTTGGNAVFAGHVDQAAHLDYAGLDYVGPGVFFRLNEIKKGDAIELDLGNAPVKYKVRWIREVAVEAGDWKSIFGSNVSVDSITLITCGGDYSRQERTYTHRIVVRAERA